MPPMAGLQLMAPEGLDALRQQQRAAAHARGSQRGLGAGMAAADDDDVEMLGKTHGASVRASRGTSKLPAAAGRLYR